jgi:hypothetical protein
MGGVPEGSQRPLTLISVFGKVKKLLFREIVFNFQLRLWLVGFTDFEVCNVSTE